jgi:hypothetical protein
MPTELPITIEIMRIVASGLTDKEKSRMLEEAEIACRNAVTILSGRGTMSPEHFRACAIEVISENGGGIGLPAYLQARSARKGK